MRIKPLIFRRLIIPVFSLFVLSLSAQTEDQPAADAAADSGDQPSIEIGKNYFRNQCAACHNKNMKDKLTGPALAGSEERWADYPREDLYNWIRNSQGMIADGHPRAVELWNEWKPTVMNAYPNITDVEIESILLYIDDVANRVDVVAGPAAAGQDSRGANNYLFYIVLVILAVLALVLSRIISNLNQIAELQEGAQVTTQRSLLEMLTSRGVVGFLIVALVVLGGYTTVNNAIALGRQQGYAPEQPIKFSHETHAGIHGIDCQYCHDGARRSKHAVIPAANTCMNCHKAIVKGSEYGTAEITKIFASIGFDPNTNTYVDDYASLGEEEIKEIYTKWIGDNYIADKSLTELDEQGQQVVDDQWQGIKNALTNDLKPEIPGPIEWIRIHHLPDHAVFNHAQHVTVGKLECQECHGKVEEMEVLGQYAPLSMGWCINCHRETEVQFNDNPYYQVYQNYHDELNSGTREKVTVEDIGGLECQKCHY